jgi:hypothetical protein
MDKSEKEITVTKAINPVDGPVDGVMIDTECIRTDFSPENEQEFTQNDATKAHISASVELGVFSIRDMSTGTMLTVSLMEAASAVAEAIENSKGLDLQESTLES